MQAQGLSTAQGRAGRGDLAQREAHTDAWLLSGSEVGAAVHMGMPAAVLLTPASA